MRMLERGDVAGTLKRSLALAILAIGAVIFANSARADMTMDECVACHDVVSKPYLHEAVLMGCDTCHEQHGKETRFAKRLKNKGNDLCLQCHKESVMRKGKGHPVANHPVIGWRDPLYPEKKFTCVSCHNPHSSSSPHLFRYQYGKYTPYADECNVCHNGTTGGANVQGPLPVPPWTE